MERGDVPAASLLLQGGSLTPEVEDENEVRRREREDERQETETRGRGCEDGTENEAKNETKNEEPLIIRRDHALLDHPQQ